MKPQNTSKTAASDEEYSTRTVSRKREEITIIERKQEPIRIDGFDL
jgi:hypothetical protein